MTTRSKTSVLIIVVLVLVVIAILAGGFMIYQRMQAQHKQNEKELERFGYEMVASSRSIETVGELG